MKTQVNSLKISLFPKILTLKLFGKSWGKSSVQFLVIISCFTFPLFYNYGFSMETVWVNINFERRDLHSNIVFTDSVWPNMEFFLVCIFLYSYWIQENTDQKKLRIWTLFTQCYFAILNLFNLNIYRRNREACQCQCFV